MCLKNEEGDKSPELWPIFFSGYASAFPDLLEAYPLHQEKNKGATF